MPGSWFLLLVFVQTGNLMTQSLTDAWLEGEEDSPTCEELRSLWNSISRSVRTSEFTNEIPLMPWDAFPNSPQRFHHHKLDKGTRKYVLPKTSFRMNPFQDTFVEEGPSSAHTIPALEPLLAPRHHSQNNAPMHGHFGDFEGPPRLGNMQGGLLLNSPSTLPGARKKGGSEAMQSESWGLPEEVGLFGRFLDLDGDFPLMTPRDRQEWPAAESAHFGSPSLDVTQETCLQILNRDCTVNDHCACIGWNTLKCILGKCNSLQLIPDKENEHGSWHRGPLPRSKLGRQKRLRRSNKYTFM